MKKLVLAMMAILTIAFVSCEKDDPMPIPGDDPQDLKGEITDAVTLDASETYKLTGALIVKTGGSLTIPAGTVIEAVGGQISYIAVAQGAKIYVNGTASDPVIMTSDDPTPGSWGGLVICGNAPTNKSDVSAGAEVSGLPYGGNVADDNSGVIKYLRVEYTGFNYNEEKQFNGVSFFGVGSGTEVDYVVSYNGKDDGIEFFGGTVNASHLVSVGSDDDGIDFADGWSGTGEYWVSLNSTKSGIEGSNNGDDGAATPMTNCTLRNLTVYGMGEKPFYLKEGAGQVNVDNIVIGGLVESKEQPIFYADSDDSDAQARITNGDVVATNARFVDIVGAQTKAVDGLSIGENPAASGAGNGVSKPDWMPDALNNVDGSTTVFGDAPSGGEVALSGDITTDVTLNATTDYKLIGGLVVTAGASLTIPAGTKIEAVGGQISYIAVAQDAQIFINGTADAPVIMTSDDPTPGSWGGLVICGKAPTNKSDASAGAEVSGLPYGGTDVSDNSGVIKYLRVEYTGFNYNEEKQFNGVSFFGVGNGTEVDYVVSYKGKDDGIEFFGGSVNASHLVSVYSDDDGIDFADGWSGTGEYWVSLNSTKSGIEGSNNGDDGAATPMTNCTLRNLTVYGMGEKPFYFKEGGGNQNIDNIVIGGLVESKSQAIFYADDDNAKARIDAGDIVVSNVKFVNIVDGSQPKAVEGLTVGENPAATGAGNGINKPSWMPDALNNVNGTETVFGDPVSGVEVALSGDITGDVELNAANDYKLYGELVVKSGASLTIPAGTVIEAKGGQISYIAVAQGGKIYINGTADAPVVMTSDDPTPGSWGGLVVCGKAPTNKSDASSGAEVSGLPYGGNVVDDNSGVIKYLRVEYTGFNYSDTKQFNGVSFFGVGNGTEVDYVVSYKGKDDGIEFFGGSVNASHLVSVYSDDDGIDFADGWSGTGEYWFSMNSTKSGIEGSNNGDDGAATPMTDCTLRNLTVYGMGEKPFYFKEGGGKQNIDNIVIGGLVDGKSHAYFYADDANAQARIDANEIVVANCKFYNIGDHDKAITGLTVGENADATGAGNGIEKPSWMSDALNTVNSTTKVIE